MFTDGQENASIEAKLDTINALIKQKESEGWAFVYLGIGPESWDAPNVGMYAGTTSSKNVRRGQRTASAVQSMSGGLTGQTITYATTGKQELTTEEEREVVE